MSVSLGALSTLYYRMELIRRNSDITQLEYEMKMSLKQTEELNKRYEIAKKQAEDDIRHFQNKSEEIMKTKVSKECGQAIKWGIEQARRIHEYV